MPDLQQLAGKLAISYDSYTNSMVEEFYVPCMQQATLYERAVAYFTSRGLSLAAQGVAHLLENEGKIHLVCSPKLFDEDIAAMRTGYEARIEVAKRIIQSRFEDFLGDFESVRLNALSWLITEGKLEVKIALPAIDEDGQRKGIYHQKIGVFSDAVGNAVAFSGSSNETEGGLVVNYETIDVYWSWDDPQKRVARKREEFDRLWNNSIPGLEVIGFTQATEEILRPYRKTRPETQKTDTVSPPKENKWRHQDEAIRIFLERERGILNMATGTGKTRTSLSIVNRLIATNSIDSVIIVAYGTDLLDQWHKVILKELPNMVVLRHYDRFHEREKYSVSPARKCLLVSRTALAPVLRKLSPNQGSKTIVIHDEIHRMGSEANVRELEGLHQSIRYRLGLSATPEREYDQEGTSFIKNEIGNVIFEFGLELAIERGILSPFDYVSLEYELLDEEKAELKSIIAADSAKRKAGIQTSEVDLWQSISAVYKRSRSKIPLFREYVKANPEILNRCVIFVFSMEYGMEVLEVVHEFHSQFHTYFADDDKINLEKFARGDLECLLTCKKLSEGIDVPSMKNIIIFSSDRSKLETIQRLGRCIRVDPNDSGKVAKVLDFVRRPKNGKKGEVIPGLDEDAQAPENADEERANFLNNLSQIRSR